MAAKKKPKTTPKKTTKTTPKKTTKLPHEALGTGAAANASRGIEKMAYRRCMAMGGKWVNGTCKF